MTETNGRHELASTTQQAYPWRAAARTAVQVFVALPTALLIIAGIFTLVAQDAFSQYLPDGWVGWLIAAAAFCAALAGVLSRIMAYPAVDAWLKRAKLSSSPSPSVPPELGGGL